MAFTPTWSYGHSVMMNTRVKPLLEWSYGASIIMYAFLAGARKSKWLAGFLMRGRF